MLSVPSPLGQGVLLRLLIWNILSTSFVREEVSHQDKITGKTTKILYLLVFMFYFLFERLQVEKMVASDS